MKFKVHLIRQIVYVLLKPFDHVENFWKKRLLVDVKYLLLKIRMLYCRLELQKPELGTLEWITFNPNYLIRISIVETFNFSP